MRQFYSYTMLHCTSVRRLLFSFIFNSIWLFAVRRLFKALIISSFTHRKKFFFFLSLFHLFFSFSVFVTISFIIIFFLSGISTCVKHVSLKLFLHICGHKCKIYTPTTKYNYKSKQYLNIWSNAACQVACRNNFCLFPHQNTERVRTK